MLVVWGELPGEVEQQVGDDAIHAIKGFLWSSSLVVEVRLHPGTRAAGHEPDPGQDLHQRLRTTGRPSQLGGPPQTLS